MFGNGSLENQAARLANPRLSMVQRQALAAEIGRAQGNRHLQRVMAFLTKADRADPSSVQPAPSAAEPGSPSGSSPSPQTIIQTNHLEAETTGPVETRPQTLPAAGSPSNGAGQNGVESSGPSLTPGLIQAKLPVDAPNEVDAPAAGRAAETATKRPAAAPTGQRRGEAPAAKRVAASGGGDRAPASPEEDPAFQAVVGKVGQVGVKQQAHPPAKQKTKEAQAAAKMPPEEKQGKAENQQAAEIEAAAAAQEAAAGEGSAPGFDKEAFKTAIKTKIEELTPSDPKDMEDIEGSGVMEETKAVVEDKVAAGKSQAQGEVDDKVEEPPDEAAVPPKPETPLQPNDPGSPPPAVDAGQAAPKPKSQAEVEQPLQEGSQQLDQQLAEADVTEAQLEKSNEPEFTGALAAKQESQTNAATAPEAYRATEQSQVDQSQTAAVGLEEGGRQAMAGTRSQVFGELDGLQQTAKGGDEAKRQEIGREINKIYEATQTDVEDTLTQLDADVDEAFNTGAQQAKDAAVRHIKTETKKYKDERYNRDGNALDQLGGLGTQAWDFMTDMPPEYYEIYNKGRDFYIEKMDIVLDRVATLVGTALTKAKARIAQGRQEIADQEIVFLQSDKTRSTKT